MFGTKYLNDEHDCNVFIMNFSISMMLMICKSISLGMLYLMKMIFLVPPSFDEKIYYDDCTSHDKNVSYKHVTFCGANWECNCAPNWKIDFVRSINI